MTDNAYENVIKLGDFEQLRRNSDGSSPAARILKEVRELAKKHLDQSIARMMEKTDDALFSRAEKAENNQAQTLYFDAMRELRIIRKDVEACFISEYTRRFDRGTPRDSAHDTSLKVDWESDDASRLGLVDKEALEEDLAITNMVNKVRGNFTQSLYALDKRIGLLLHDPDLEKWLNPLGPEPVCKAFKEAAQKIETGIEIRLVILKLFDQHVMSNIGSMYKEVNQHLVRRGVMPEIKTTIRKSSSASMPAYQQPTAAGVTENSSASHSQSPCSTNNYTPSTGMPAGVFQPMSNLTYLQHGTLPEILTTEGYNTAAINMDEVDSGRVNILYGIKQSGLVSNLGRSGDMTIDIVAMIFDYILDDPDTPDAMRALIGRLQIPVLKVALLDKNFFGKKSHPARQLLNRLAALAIGWNEDQGTQDPLYKHINNIVQTILNDFDDDISLFSSLLSDLEIFLHRNEEEARIREQRSAKVMEGQERLEVARSTTMKEITPRVEDKHSLDFVRKFVSTHWKNLLFVTCAKYGKDSEEWKKSVETMDVLIWSVKPKTSIEDRKKLVTLQPGLLQAIREGMERLSLPTVERDAFINDLVRAHGRTASGNPGEIVEDKHATDEISDKTCVDESVTSTATTNTEKPEPVKNENTDAPVIDDKYMQMARRIKPGTWVEFKNRENITRRVKFSWISPITGSYLFTDRQGLKSASLTLAEFAHYLRNTRARIIDAEPLLDRAVSTVLKDYNK